MPEYTDDSLDTPPEELETARVTSLEVGDIPFDEEVPGFVDQEPGTVFGDYLFMNHYEHDQHRVMLGITAPEGFNGETAAFCQLASPTLLWVCEWTASRFGAQPVIPSVNPPGGWVLLKTVPNPAMLKMVQDSVGGMSPFYRMNGTYIYGCRKPSVNVYDHTTYPRPPWMEESVFTRNQPATYSVRTLINDQAGGQGGTGFSQDSSGGDGAVTDGSTGGNNVGGGNGIVGLNIL